MTPTSALRPFDDAETASLADRAYGRILEAIVGGNLPPGNRISERGLAAALDISAQPVRDALRRLEAEGLVESRPRSGTYVADLGPARLTEIGLIRVALEGVAASLAALRARTADHSALDLRLAAVRAATRADDLHAVMAANDALHDTIHAAAGSRDVARLLAGLRAYDHMTRARVLATRAERRRAQVEHTAIVAAIAAGDAPAAEAAMRGHATRSLALAIPGAGKTMHRPRKAPAKDRNAA